MHKAACPAWMAVWDSTCARIQLTVTRLQSRKVRVTSLSSSLRCSNTCFTHVRLSFSRDCNASTSSLTRIIVPPDHQSGLHFYKCFFGTRLPNNAFIRRFANVISF